MLPMSVKKLTLNDIDVSNRVDMARREDSFVNYSDDQVPWLAPLRELTTGATSQNWTKKYQAMLIERAANGIWSPERLKLLDVKTRDGSDRSDVCLVCGMQCKQSHRDLECLGRYWQRQQYGLPDGLLRMACINKDTPLWTRAIMPDPTLALAPPSEKPPVWTIAADPNNPKFDGDGFGDGSGIELVDHKTNRTAFSVVQLERTERGYRIRNCVIGPLVSFIQEVPLAELAALWHFLMHALDIPAMTFFSD